MATAISKVTLVQPVSGVTPGIAAEVTYDYWRSGNNMVYKVTVSMNCISSGAWYNNRLACKLKVNGSWIWTNQTIKAQTSGTIGTKVYSATTGEIKVPINSGTVPLVVEFADTGFATGWDPSLSNFDHLGEKSGSLAVSAPSAPSKPSSISIPGSAAPDQTVTVSWAAASGGTNGVSGYQLAYSKDGGSTWSYKKVSGTSTTLDLNALGFKHGSVLRCAVQSYSTVNSVDYASEWVYSGNTTTSFTAPSTPSTINIPSSIAPDKTASISWSATSGGTNGVKGYHWQYSKDGGSNWSEGGTTTGTSASLNLNSAGFGHGSRLAVRVRAYTTGQGANYYGGWKTSGVTTTSFVAPSAPRSVVVSTDMPEPIPTGTYKAGWTAPSSTGTNGVSGYRIQWLKNGANFGSEYDVSGTSASKAVTESDIQPGDTISFKVRAYTIGQNTRYYSDYTTSGTITIVSDKFIYISQNGASFVKYKAFISVNGGSFKEIKKEKLKVIK